MAHKANLYLVGPDCYCICLTCGWRSKTYKTPYEADYSRTVHRIKTSLNLKHFWYLIKAYRYGYKPCPCHSGCEVCSGFGFLPMKGAVKFDKEFYSV